MLLISTATPSTPTTVLIPHRLHTLDNTRKKWTLCTILTGPMLEDQTRKRELRLLKNREAARECRRKKKEYIKCLENRVAVLENQNKALIEELKSLKELYCQQKTEWGPAGWRVCRASPPVRAPTHCAARAPRRRTSIRMTIYLPCLITLSLDDANDYRTVNFSD